MLRVGRCELRAASCEANSCLDAPRGIRGENASASVFTGLPLMVLGVALEMQIRVSPGSDEVCFASCGEVIQTMGSSVNFTLILGVLLG